MSDKAGWIGLFLLFFTIIVGLGRTCSRGDSVPIMKSGNTLLTYKEASELSRRIIRERMERLSYLHCQKSHSIEEFHEELGLSMPPRVNTNIVKRCAQFEDLERYTKGMKRYDYWRIKTLPETKIEDPVLLHNEKRLKEGSYKPQLFILEDAENFQFDYETPGGISLFEVSYEREGTCSTVYGLPASRMIDDAELNHRIYCGMEVLEVSEPEVVYRRNFYGNFSEYDYVQTLPWTGRELPALDPEAAWKIIAADDNPSRFPFVWRAEVKVRMKTGTIGYVEWDWVEDGMPDSRDRIDPRWTVSSIKPDRTKWIAPFTICSLTGSRKCVTVHPAAGRIRYPPPTNPSASDSACDSSSASSRRPYPSCVSQPRWTENASVLFRVSDSSRTRPDRSAPVQLPR